MPQNPAFSITGSPFFDSTTVSFQVSFQNQGDQAFIQAYEWYIDGVIIAKQIADEFNEQINCGSHTIGVRVLSNNLWTGIQELTFATCKPVSNKYISGPADVIIGQSEPYDVIWEFADGTTADMTANYTFIAKPSGSFSGNIFTAADDGSGDDSISVTIFADQSGSTSLNKQITVTAPDTNAAGILVVDLYRNTSLNVIGLIANSEVIDNHVPVYTGVNIIPVDSDPAIALILASDLIEQKTLNWRFLFNLAKLKTEYPDTAEFVLYIKGRGSEAGPLSGAYNLKNETEVMIMTGEPGNYAPTTSGGGQIGPAVRFNSQVVSGANGSYAEADLSMIVQLTYTVVDDSITIITDGS